MPKIVLATTWNDNLFQPNSRFANDFGFLVVVKDAHFKVIVIGGVMNCKAKLLVPGEKLVNGQTV